MTDSNRSMNEVPGLVAERRRYEGWLLALDARRNTTPVHVFERVQGDYRARLQRVDEQLAAHRHAIEDERANLQSRLSLCEAEERMGRDERTELELRAHVGELIGDEADAAFRTVDESLNKLLVEKNALQVRISELDGLLERRDTPREPEAAAATADVASAEEAAAAAASVAADTQDEQLAIAGTLPPKPQQGLRPSFDEMAFLNNVVGREVADAPAAAVAASAAPAAAPAAPAAAPSPRTSPMPPRSAENRRDSGMVRVERTSDSLLAGLGDSPRDPDGDAPLAANVTANTPIVLRAGSLEGSKTLKCAECGSMNYPTEWYCERCGAELAAL